MPIETICPGCSRKLRVGDEFAGKQARCPACNEIYSVTAETGVIRDVQNVSSWRMKTPEGQIYGPVSKEELDKWVTDGRVTASCELAPDQSAWEPADAFYPVLKEVPTAIRSQVGNPTQSSSTIRTATTPYTSPGGGTTRYRHAAAHRGGLILALGVISWVVGCPIFGLFAWVMGSGDLRDMRLGRMDPSGMGLTQAGQVLGMIHSILVIIMLVIFVFVMLLAVVAR